MSIRLGVIMDPIEKINFKKDTTLALLLAAQKRGWDLGYILQSDLYLDAGTPRALTQPLKVFNDPDSWFELGEQTDTSLSDFDVLIMRKDPPFDNEYIYSTYILEAAQRLGTLVVNDPRSLRDCNEKIFATQFPQCCPPYW